MRPQKVSDHDVLAALAETFRAKGYEGASLKELSEATGLQKASLYHRFPRGKQEMAEAVFAHLQEWVEEHVFRTLTHEGDPPTIRLKKGLSQIRILYKGGQEVCILRALSMQTGLELFEAQIQSGMHQWIAAFEKVGLALAFSPEEAKQKALQTLISLQGSLVVARGLNDPTLFEDTLRTIERTYIKT
ncbi:DNA-binding transcriptional regulator, AcrR family [Catalinimonas alkaloidigena]|uniref:DNA-binding transcriptional regulator, AcrR family n=1 Tax=Catalinimonas alkaloidigena TaxID=1075417 RepID=A0A1G9KPW1_9BACT|nr:TetR/AcrR family transcriptional regulator [Catalinimonas alkaloidigena]SDL51870.1 DNA-binding transcriptional regulator, AcrR family [Catalinimonas alkaloidigena]